MVQESAKSEKESETEGRKWSKPIMEKRRRERINRSLDELKRLVLEAQNRDCSRYTKLEKADILEMTVRHLRGLRHHQRSVLSAPDPHMLLKYRAGYSACVAEVSKCMVADDRVDPRVKPQILSHLSSCSNTPGLPEDLSEMSLQSGGRIPTALHFGPGTEPGTEEPRRMFPRDSTESPFSQNHTGISPFMVQSQRLFPQPGPIPLHYVPVLSPDSGTTPGLHALVPGGPSSRLQLRDPLWRPW